jgi:RimJ/RimL family protein N-acetyltransferase
MGGRPCLRWTSLAPSSTARRSRAFRSTVEGSAFGPPCFSGRVTELRTPRLLLREWGDADIDQLAAINADPEVMRYIAPPFTRERTEAFVEWQRGIFAERGWGLWAVEIERTGELAGVVGLNEPGFVTGVEISWRLAREQWDKGYATEAARAALAFGFDELALEEIVSFTTVQNTRSRRVMERIGMTRDPAEDFAHPHVPEGDPLRPHVLYRLQAAARETA